jgi:hypothetical protein
VPRRGLTGCPRKLNEINALEGARFGVVYHSRVLLVEACLRPAPNRVCTAVV